MDVILSTSSKGGVGKSEVSRLTARQLKRDGNDVAMMDADIDSSNLSSRMGAEGRVEQDDNDMVKPVKVDGIQVYSMESAFSDSSFSQSGEFMRKVIQDMVNSTDWGDPDYLVVDCPPGTKDIFDELISVMREDILGAIVIGQSDTVDDVARMVKVCNHNYVPIIGFIENMSGVYAEGELVEKPKSSNVLAPFGRGDVKQLSKKINGRYLGSIPLCEDPSDIESAASNTIKSISIAVDDAERPSTPDLSKGDKGFVRNVLKGVKSAIQTFNKELDIDSIQERFGNPDDPKVMAIELEDAKSSWLLPSKIYIKIENGINVIKNPDNVYAGMTITSQELKFALERERMVMDSAQALYINDPMNTAPYGLVDAVQMGKADAWGENVINQMSLLDRVFNDVIDESKLQEAAESI